MRTLTTRDIYKPPDFHGLRYDVATAMSGWLLMGSGMVAYYITFIEMNFFFWYTPFWLLLITGLTINMEGIVELGAFGASLAMFSVAMLVLQTLQIIMMVEDFGKNCDNPARVCLPFRTTPGIIVYFVAYSALAVANIIQLPCFLFFYYNLFRHRWAERRTILIADLPGILSVSRATQTTD